MERPKPEPSEPKKPAVGLLRRGIGSCGGIGQRVYACEQKAQAFETDGRAVVRGIAVKNGGAEEAWAGRNVKYNGGHGVHKAAKPIHGRILAHHKEQKSEIFRVPYTSTVDMEYDEDR